MPVLMMCNIIHGLTWDHQFVWILETVIQGGSNMTGTDVARFTHKQSRSYLNHLVFLSHIHGIFWHHKCAVDHWWAYNKIFRIILSCANPWPLTALYWKRQNIPCGTVFYKSYTTSGICRVCLALFLPSSRTVTSVSFHFSVVFEIIYKIMEYSRAHF